MIASQNADGTITKTAVVTDLPDNVALAFRDEDSSASTFVNLIGSDARTNVMLGDGNQLVTVDNVGGSIIDVIPNVIGDKVLTAGRGGDLLINESTDAFVTMNGGIGNDTIVANGGENELIDLTFGGADRIYAPNGASVTGYDAGSGGAFVIDVDSVYDAIENHAINFGNGSFSVQGMTDAVSFDENENGLIDVNFLANTGRTTRVMSTYPRGGIANASDTTQAILFVGNYGSNSGESSLLGGAGNDTFIAGASTDVFTGAGNNNVYLKNTDDSGATIDQTAEDYNTARNNIVDYDPLRNTIRISEKNYSRIRASFVNGQLVTTFNNTTNTFLASSTNALAELPSLDEETGRNSLWGGDSGNESIFSGDAGLDELDFGIVDNEAFVSSMQDDTEFAINNNLALRAALSINKNVDRPSQNQH